MKFFNDVKKFWHYAIYAAKSDLKSEVASSYLNWVWWVLEPLCMMLIYAFIFGYVFKASEQYFTVFIFIGLTMWDFFNRMVSYSVKSVKSNKAIVSKVYLPKYILLIEKMLVNGFKMAISFGIIAIMMVIYKVPLTINIVYVPFVLIVLFVFTFAITVHLQHFGVFVEDLANVVRIVLRFVFYMTGIFYNIQTRLPGRVGNMLLKVNPMATLLSAMRKSLIYGQVPPRKLMLLILIGSILLATWGVKRIYKYENSYAKVI